jgi:hypothetical protein
MSDRVRAIAHDLELAISPIGPTSNGTALTLRLGKPFLLSAGVVMNSVKHFALF